MTKAGQIPPQPRAVSKRKGRHGTRSASRLSLVSGEKAAENLGRERRGKRKGGHGTRSASRLSLVSGKKAAENLGRERRGKRKGRVRDAKCVQAQPGERERTKSRQQKGAFRRGKVPREGAFFSCPPKGNGCLLSAGYCIIAAVARRDGCPAHSKGRGGAPPGKEDVCLGKPDCPP